MKLLLEPIFEDTQIEFISEGENQQRKLYISGPFSFHTTINRNGRIYPENIMDREINKFKSLIESGQAVGELDHPDTPKLNLHNISHRITSLQKEGKTYFGKALVLDTPSGRIARNLAENGVKLGISSRALGSLTDTSRGKIVNEDLRVITWDIVARPSFSEAIMDTIYESKEWELINGRIIEVEQDFHSDNHIQKLLEEVKRWRDLYFKELILNQLGGLGRNG